MSPKNQHTPEHDNWDQGGFCNALVAGPDGCGEVCGYRAPYVARSNERLLGEDSLLRVDVERSTLTISTQHRSLRPMSMSVTLSKADRIFVARELLKDLDL